MTSHKVSDIRCRYEIKSIRTKYDMTLTLAVFGFQGEFDAGYLYECQFATEEQKANREEGEFDEPIRAIPVVDSDDVPIHTISWR
jgi:hypothetical protein